MCQKACLHFSCHNGNLVTLLVTTSYVTCNYHLGWLCFEVANLRPQSYYCTASLSHHFRHLLLTVVHAVYTDDDSTGGILDATSLQIVVFGSYDAAIGCGFGDGC